MKQQKRRQDREPSPKGSVASSRKELYIEDGDILFCFIDKDGTEHGIDFLTSEYYYEGGNYYTVREREKLRGLMDRVRDYYQMEVKNGE